MFLWENFDANGTMQCFLLCFFEMLMIKEPFMAWLILLNLTFDFTFFSGVTIRMSWALQMKGTTTFVPEVISIVQYKRKQKDKFCTVNHFQCELETQKNKKDFALQIIWSEHYKRKQTLLLHYKLFVVRYKLRKKTKFALQIICSALQTGKKDKICATNYLQCATNAKKKHKFCATNHLQCVLQRRIFLRYKICSDHYKSVFLQWGTFSNDLILLR